MNESELLNLCQFIEFIKTTETLKGQKTFRKHKNNLPISIKVSDGDVYLISKKVLGTGEFKKAKTGGLFEKEIRVVWATANLAKADTKEKKQEIQNKFLQEVTHEARIYDLLKDVEGVAKYLDVQTYLDKTETAEKKSVVMPVYDTSLEKLMHSGIKLTPEQKKDLSIGMLRALKGMHDKNVTHQDLKPDNIFITIEEDPDGDQAKTKYIPFIADMGLATVVPNIIKRFGTVGYLSPEIFTRQISKHAGHLKEDEFAFHEDNFAMGEIILELVTGKDSSWCEEQKTLQKILIKGPQNHVERTKLASHINHLNTPSKKPADESSIEFACWRLLDPNATTRADLDEAINIILRSK